MNLPTILIAAVILAVFVAIVAGEIKKRKRGGGCGCGCGCGCSGCPGAGLCHPDPEKK